MKCSAVAVFTSHRYVDITACLILRGLGLRDG